MLVVFPSVALQAGKLWLSGEALLGVCVQLARQAVRCDDWDTCLCDWPGRWLDVMFEIPVSVWLARQFFRCDDWDTCQCVIGQAVV